MSESHRRHRLLGHAAILTTALLWGSLIPLLDILLAHIDLFALSMIRYDVAGLLLLGAVIVTGGTAWLRGLPYGKVLLLGIVGMAGFATFYTLAIAYSAPGTAIVINAATPIISAVFAAIVYRMPFEKGTGIAFLLAAIGAAISSLGREGANYAFDIRGGELFLVIAAICWAWYSINAQSWLAGLVEGGDGAGARQRGEGGELGVRGHREGDAVETGGRCPPGDIDVVTRTGAPHVERILGARRAHHAEIAEKTLGEIEIGAAIGDIGDVVDPRHCDVPSHT